MGSPVGHDGVEFAIARGCLVNAYAFADVVGEHEPLLRMGKLTPLAVATKNLFVLFFKVSPFML